MMHFDSQEKEDSCVLLTIILGSGYHMKASHFPSLQSPAEMKVQLNVESQIYHPFVLSNCYFNVLFEMM